MLQTLLFCLFISAAVAPGVVVGPKNPTPKKAAAPLRRLSDNEIWDIIEKRMTERDRVALQKILIQKVSFSTTKTRPGEGHILLGTATAAGAKLPAAVVEFVLELDAQIRKRTKEVCPELKTDKQVDQTRTFRLPSKSPPTTDAKANGELNEEKSRKELEVGAFLFIDHLQKCVFGAK